MIELIQVSKTYQKPGAVPVRAVDDVSLQIERGEFVAILGPSGSGKSTLMSLMGLLCKPDGGRYRLDEREVGDMSDDVLASVRNKMIGFVFQAYHLLPRSTAIENVQLPLLYANDADYKARSAAALEAVGLGERMHHFSHELSGGQQQRVAIARALANRPSVLLADEPTGNLDSASAAAVMDLFRTEHAKGTTIVMITHDETVAGAAGRIIRLRDGAIESDERSGAAQVTA